MAWAPSNCTIVWKIIAKSWEIWQRVQRHHLNHSKHQAVHLFDVSRGNLRPYQPPAHYSIYFFIFIFFIHLMLHRSTEYWIRFLPSWLGMFWYLPDFQYGIFLHWKDRKTLFLRKDAKSFGRNVVCWNLFGLWETVLRCYEHLNVIDKVYVFIVIRKHCYRCRSQRSTLHRKSCFRLLFSSGI